MKNRSILLLLLLLTACTVAPVPTATPIPPTHTAAPPTATATLEPTPLPTSTPAGPAIIEPENAPGLQQAAELRTPLYPSRVIWSQDGKSLVVLHEGGVKVFDAAALQETSSYNTPDGMMLLDIAPDAKTVATSQDFLTLELREISTGAVLKTIDPGEQFVGASFSPEGSLLALARSDEFGATIWDVASGEFRFKVGGFETAAPVYAVTFAPSVTEIVYAARGTIQIQNMVNGQLSPTFSHEDFVSAFVLAKDHPWLVTSAGGTLDGNFLPLIYLWDTASGQTLQKITLDTPAYRLAFSPDEKMLAAAAGPEIILLDTSTWQPVTRLNGDANSFNDVSFSPDGQTLAAVTSSGMLRLWQTAP